MMIQIKSTLQGINAFENQLRESSPPLLHEPRAGWAQANARLSRHWHTTPKKPQSAIAWHESQS